MTASAHGLARSRDAGLEPEKPFRGAISFKDSTMSTGIRNVIEVIGRSLARRFFKCSRIIALAMLRRLKVLRLQSRMLRDPCQHARSNVVRVMKRKDVVRKIVVL